jgi:hypothetical protein
VEPFHDRLGRRARSELCNVLAEELGALGLDADDPVVALGNGIKVWRCAHKSRRTFPFEAGRLKRIFLQVSASQADV